MSEGSIALKGQSSIDATYQSIRAILEKARGAAYRAVNFAMVQAYWEIGRIIVEEEQRGAERAEYGKALIKELSVRLTRDYGKGFIKRNLWYMRDFYLTYPKVNALRSELTWAHYRLLLKVEKEEARNFYMLEFLDLNESRKFLEKDMEHALIDELQAFLLELGRGFSFVARQRRITVDFYVRYVEKEEKLDGDNPTIGLILCSDKNGTMVRYTLLEDSKQIFASKYTLYLPTEEKLKAELEQERKMPEIEKRLGGNRG